MLLPGVDLESMAAVTSKDKADEDSKSTAQTEKDTTDEEFWIAKLRHWGLAYFTEKFRENKKTDMTEWLDLTCWELESLGMSSGQARRFIHRCRNDTDIFARRNQFTRHGLEGDQVELLISQSTTLTQKYIHKP